MQNHSNSNVCKFAINASLLSVTPYNFGGAIIGSFVLFLSLEKVDFVRKSCYLYRIGYTVRPSYCINSEVNQTRLVDKISVSWTRFSCFLDVFPFRIHVISVIRLVSGPMTYSQKAVQYGPYFTSNGFSIMVLFSHFYRNSIVHIHEIIEV